MPLATWALRYSIEMNMILLCGCSDGHDHARAENLAHARALIELDHTKNL